jgi:hypothetical protein
VSARAERFIRRGVERAALSPRSKRALLEAILDWKHEACAAGTRAERFMCHVRSSAALARVLAMSVLTECGEALRPGWSLRLLLWSVVALVLPWSFRSVMPTDSARLAFILLTQVLILMPFVLFFCVATGPKRLNSPVVGFACAAAAVVAAIVFIALPALHQSPVVLYTPVSFLMTVVAHALLLFLADRVRTDRARALLVVAVPVGLVGFNVALYASPDPFAVFSPVPVRWFVSLAGSIAIWYTLARRQEREATRVA